MGTKRSLSVIPCLLALGLVAGICVRVWPQFQDLSYYVASAILLLFGLLALHAWNSRVLIRHRELRLVFELTSGQQCELHIKNEHIKNPRSLIRLLENIGPCMCQAQRANSVPLLLLDSPIFAQERKSKKGRKRFHSWSDLVRQRQQQMFPGAILESIAPHDLSLLYRLRLIGLSGCRAPLVSSGFRVVV